MEAQQARYQHCINKSLWNSRDLSTVVAHFFTWQRGKSAGKMTHFGTNYGLIRRRNQHSQLVAF